MSNFNKFKLWAGKTIRYLIGTIILFSFIGFMIGVYYHDHAGEYAALAANKILPRPHLARAY